MAVEEWWCLSKDACAGYSYSCSCPFGYLKQTQRAQASMKMRLSNSGRDLCTRQTQTVGAAQAFGFDYPQRKLRQSFFHVMKMRSRKVQMHGTFGFGCKLFCHKRLSACHGFPI